MSTDTGGMGWGVVYKHSFSVSTVIFAPASSYPWASKQLDERQWGNRLGTEFLKWHATGYKLKKEKEGEVPFCCDTLRRPQHLLGDTPPRMWEFFVVAQSPRHECHVTHTKLCPTLCDPMDFSIPGSSVLHCLPELTQILVHLSWWCYLTIFSCAALLSFCPQSFLASGSFPVSRLFTLGDQSIGSPASASVLPMNIQCYWGAVHIQTHPIPPSNVT